MMAYWGWGFPIEPSKRNGRMDDYSDLIKRLRLYEDPMSARCVRALEAQANLIAELEAFRKKELDFYLFDKKRLSRRISLLEGWMKKLFTYAKSPDATRNHFTMMTEIPDTLMREGIDYFNRE